MPRSLQDGFDRTLLRLTTEEGGRFLLGVSGGIDSMAMARLFKDSRLHPSFAIAHVNFSLRGEDSDGDEAFVKDWAESNGIEFFTTRFDTRAYAARKGISIEMAARELRYGWFGTLLDKHGFDWLAVAHNRNDAAETMCLNLLRGTGIRGISGMKELSGKIIRPLLSFTRQQIEDFALEKRIHHREDATNSDSSFARNRIRNKVFPQFAKINPSYLETASREMAHFAQIEALLDELLEQKKELLTVRDGDAFCIDIDLLAKESQPRYWLFRLLQPFGFSDDILDRIEASLDGQSGKTFFSSTHKAIRDRRFLKVYPIADSDPVQVDISVFDIEDGFDPRSADGSVLFVDADKVSLPIECRRWQAADRFRPFGMKGFRKLSDFFTDLKLDLEQKQRQTVVTTVDRQGEEQIVCIAGLRIDDRYRVTADTKRVVRISCRVQK
jgi:tRNA(Ile)-lysidine synthase